ncbi:SWR1-complex protein 7 [Nakaseomyces bracarensis]|uniref:SWR1-complex protein 7 n=1 Tax=Nakaseomyces bracarensis TaxID=273131 RepID=A0ABR4NX38_9SACH
MTYGSNMVLLVLQIILQHQHSLVGRDKDLDIKKLMAEPVIDAEVLTKCQNHTMIKMYAPELAKITLRNLRFLVEEWFASVPELRREDVTLVTLANHYYALRISEIEDDLPKIRNETKAIINTYTQT